MIKDESNFFSKKKKRFIAILEGAARLICAITSGLKP